MRQVTLVVILLDRVAPVCSGVARNGWRLREADYKFILRRRIGAKLGGYGSLFFRCRCLRAGVVAAVDKQANADTYNSKNAYLYGLTYSLRGLCCHDGPSVIQQPVSICKDSMYYTRYLMQHHRGAIAHPREVYHKNMKLTKRFDRQCLRIWLVAVVIGGGLTLFAYTAVQQSLRLGLNDPQWQIAEDAAVKLAAGATPASVIPQEMIDEATSLAPFVTIVDRHERVLATSGKIGAVVPLPPASAFPDAQKRGDNWFTWQHDNNTVRDATVIVPYGGTHPGYVLAARSMHTVEDTISHITALAALTLLGVLIAPAIVLFLV